MLARNGAGTGEGLTSPAGPVSDHDIRNVADIGQLPAARQEQRIAATQTLAALAELFPECFAPVGGRHRPLKRGIHRDLIECGILTVEECRRVMRAYVMRRQYQRALAAGGARVDLDGNSDGEVTPEEIEGAKRALDSIDTKLRTRREERQRQEGLAFIEELRKRRLEREAPEKANAPRGLGLADLKAAFRARKGGAS